MLKVGGKVSPLSEQILFPQLIINGRVYIDQKQAIKDLAPDSKVLIFRTEPELFKDIEKHYLELMGLNDE